jgi:hypothetical protein
MAMLARVGDRELRPVLLTHHTREFVSSPMRDRRTVATYEALALGLIPLVPDDVVADISAMLRQVPETPARVIELLRGRRTVGSPPHPVTQAASAGLSRLDVADLLTLAEGDVDLALARNGAAPLDAHAREVLVSRAAKDGTLAEALLARTELSAWERGALFAFAPDAISRDGIRVELERAVAVSAPALPALSAWRQSRLMRSAARGDVAGLAAELAKTLGLARVPDWRLDEPAQSELFASALVAAGLKVEDCVRVLLTADRRIAASVPAVFRLREVCRTTSRAVAWQLVGGSTTPRRGRAAASGAAGRPKQAVGARALSATDPARGLSAPPASAPADRRLRSTTGRDRS